MRRVLRISILLVTLPVAVILFAITVLAYPASLQQQQPALLHLGASASTTIPTAVVPARQLIPKMHWGTRDISGLRLGAYYDPQAHVIYGLIRNAGAHEATINAYQFGCPGYIKVYARLAGTTPWIEVSYGSCAHGVGPSARDNVIVQPGQCLIGQRNLQFAGTAEHRTIARIKCSFSAMAVTSRLPNPDHRPVELRVEHKLPNDGSRDVWQGTLSSAIFTVSAAALPHLPIGTSGGILRSIPEVQYSTPQ